MARSSSARPVKSRGSTQRPRAPGWSAYTRRQQPDSARWRPGTAQQPSRKPCAAPVARPSSAARAGKKPDQRHEKSQIRRESTLRRNSGTPQLRNDRTGNSPLPQATPPPLLAWGEILRSWHAVLMASLPQRLRAYDKTIIPSHYCNGLEINSAQRRNDVGRRPVTPAAGSTGGGFPPGLAPRQKQDITVNK